MSPAEPSGTMVATGGYVPTELDALRAEVAALRQQLASKDQAIAELRSVMFERAMAIK